MRSTRKASLNPTPRMGRAEVERPVLQVIAIATIVALGALLVLLLLVPEPQGAPQTTVKPSIPADNQEPRGLDLASHLFVTPDAAPESATLVSSPLRAVSSRASAKSGEVSPTLPKTARVLEILDRLLATFDYSPYFIRYRREVTNLEKALEDLAASDEPGRISTRLVYCIDEAAYAHTRLRSIWKLKTDPTVTEKDLKRALSRLRVRTSPPSQEAPFRSLRGTFVKRSPFQIAVENLKAHARKFTALARETYEKEARSSAARSADHRTARGWFQKTWGN